MMCAFLKALPRLSDATGAHDQTCRPLNVTSSPDFVTLKDEETRSGDEVESWDSAAPAVHRLVGRRQVHMDIAR